jgi:hypothetical protein
MLPTFLVTMTAVSLLEIGMAIPLIRRRVKPNGLYGVRTSDTFADEWVWYEANAASGRDLVRLGGFQLAGLYLPLLFSPVNLGLYLVGNLGLVFVGTLVAATIAVARAHFMRKRRLEGISPSAPS